MNNSFYRNLIVVIGVLAAIEFAVQFGISKAIFPIVIDVVVVFALVFLINQWPVNNGRAHIQDENVPSDVESQAAKLNRWQKQHDQWWQRYKRRARQLKSPTRRNLKGQINHLDKQLILIKNQKSRLLIHERRQRRLQAINFAGFNRQTKQLSKQISRLQKQLGSTQKSKNPKK